jgi:hypothetical protein
MMRMKLPCGDGQKANPLLSSLFMSTLLAMAVGMTIGVPGKLEYLRKPNFSCGLWSINLSSQKTICLGENGRVILVAIFL